MVAARNNEQTNVSIIELLVFGVLSGVYSQTLVDGEENKQETTTPGFNVKLFSGNALNAVFPNARKFHRIV